MIRVGTFLLQTFAATALLAAIASVDLAAAQDSPEPSIATAKKDYEAIKEAARDAKQPASAVAKPSVPPLELGTDKVPVLSPMQRARQIESLTPKLEAKKSENWLLDAMAANEVHSKEKETSNRSADAHNRRVRDDSQTATERRQTSDRTLIGRHIEVADTAERPVTTAVNPLGDFMARWMSPNDLQLLQPPAREGELNISPMAPNYDSGPRSNPLQSVIVPGAAMGRLNGSQNPYVTDTNVLPPLVTRDAKDFPASTGMAPIQSIRPFTPPSLVPPSEPAKPSAKEPLRPADDTRLFKQLKRF